MTNVNMQQYGLALLCHTAIFSQHIQSSNEMLFSMSHAENMAILYLQLHASFAPNLSPDDVEALLRAVHRVLSLSPGLLQYNKMFQLGSEKLQHWQQCKVTILDATNKSIRNKDKLLFVYHVHLDAQSKV